jgi:hypothetical protein
MSSQLLDTPAKHPFSIFALADRAYNGVFEAAVRTGWSPVTKVAEVAVMKYTLPFTLFDLQLTRELGSCRTFALDNSES